MSNNTGKFSEAIEKWCEEQKRYADWAKQIEEGKFSPMENLWRYKEKIYNETILKYSAKGAIGLEIGSGAGRTCKFLRENGRYTIGVDPLSHNNIYNLVVDSLLSAIGEYLPFKNNSFDFVITKATLDHTISPQEVFYEVNRVLKDDGYFIICQNVKEKDKSHQHIFEIETIKELGRRVNFKFLCQIPLYIRIPLPSWRLRMTLIKSKLYIKINRLIATIFAKYSHHLIFVFKK
jgi:SAM-dependent methyltransferase